MSAGREAQVLPSRTEEGFRNKGAPPPDGDGAFEDPMAHGAMGGITWRQTNMPLFRSWLKPRRTTA